MVEWHKKKKSIQFFGFVCVSAFLFDKIEKKLTVLFQWFVWVCAFVCVCVCVCVCECECLPH